MPACARQRHDLVQAGYEDARHRGLSRAALRRERDLAEEQPVHHACGPGERAALREAVKELHPHGCGRVARRDRADTQEHAQVGWIGHGTRHNRMDMQGVTRWPELEDQGSGWVAQDGAHHTDHQRHQVIHNVSSG